MEFTVVNEKKRTYVFPGNHRVSYDEVQSVCVRPSGTHRLNLKDGKKVIVPAKWLSIELEGVETWSM